MIGLVCRRTFARKLLRRPCKYDLFVGKLRSAFFSGRTCHLYRHKLLPAGFRTLSIEAKTNEPSEIAKTEAKTNEQSGIAKRKWPIIITTVIASIIGYFWKGRLEKNDLEALHERLNVRVLGKSCNQHLSTSCSLFINKWVLVETDGKEINNLRMDNNIRLGLNLHANLHTSF